MVIALVDLSLYVMVKICICLLFHSNSRCQTLVNKQKDQSEISVGALSFCLGKEGLGAVILALQTQRKVCVLWVTVL